MSIDSVRLGKNSRMKINGSEIGRIRSGSLDISHTAIDVTSLGDKWRKTVPGMSEWGLQCSGIVDFDDSLQLDLQSKALSGGSFDDFEVWADTSVYYTCDTSPVISGGDPEANVSVESFNLKFDNNDVVTFDLKLKGNGPLIRVVS